MRSAPLFSTFPAHAVQVSEHHLVVTRVVQVRARHLALAPCGRRDACAGVVDNWLSAPPNLSAACTSSPVAFYQPTQNAMVLWDGTTPATANSYISAQICGTGPNDPGNGVYGIIKRSPSGVLSHFAGRVAGSTSDGVAATMTFFADTPLLARKSDGTVFASITNGHRIRRIDPSGLVFNYAGNGVAGFAGDYVPVGNSQVSAPHSMVVLPSGHLAISDRANTCVRIVW